MSEHVIDTTDGFLEDAVDLKALFGPRLHEELIRCIDCDHFSEHEQPEEFGYPHYCDNFYVELADVDGFCKWAIPKGAGDE